MLASEGFLKTTNLKVGDVTPVFLNSAFFPMRIEGTFNLFATLGDPRKQSAVVTDLQRLQAQINIASATPTPRCFADASPALKYNHVCSVLHGQESGVPGPNRRVLVRTCGTHPWRSNPA